MRRVSKCFKESTKSCSRKPALLTLFFSDLNHGPFRVYFVRALRLSNRISNHVAQKSSISFKIFLESVDSFNSVGKFGA